MDALNLAEIREGFRGKPFYQLVQHRFERQSQEKQIQGGQGTMAMLPAEAQLLTEDFINRWNTRACDRDFWRRDSALVFDEITKDADRALAKVGLASTDETLLNIFNVVVLNYAYSAYDQPKMREFVGISARRFPWLSGLSLLYPLGAMLHIATHTPAPFTMVVGYGLGNLGYVLFGAGVFAGTFRVFGLKKRWQVFIASVVCFAACFILSNINTGTAR